MLWSLRSYGEKENVWFLSSDALRNEKTFNIHSCFCCAPITRWISRILTHPCAPIPSSIFLFHGENEMVPPSCQDCKKRWAFTSQTRTLLGVPLFEKWSIQTAFARGGAFYKGAPSHPVQRLHPPPKWALPKYTEHFLLLIDVQVWSVVAVSGQVSLK